MSFSKTFDNKGTFEALRACESWLRERGYSYGPTCAMCPVAVLKGDYCIAKWRNLTRKERSQIDGSVSGDFREGPLILHLKVSPWSSNDQHKSPTRS